MERGVLERNGEGEERGTGEGARREQERMTKEGRELLKNGELGKCLCAGPFCSLPNRGLFRVAKRLECLCA
jgi:hypothetical protein